MLRVYRVQDRHGRGPFKPGLSDRWLDDVRQYFQPSFLEELGPAKSEWLAEQLGRPGEHYGCACRTLADLGRWFSPTERPRLQLLGYSAVSMTIDRLIWESADQLLIARRRPLARGVVVVPWASLGQQAGDKAS